MGEMEVHRKKGLAPCPLCDSEAVFVNYGGGVFVKCSCCECMIARQISVTTQTILPFENEEQAIKVWNKRCGLEVDARYHESSATPIEVLQARDRRVERILNVLKKRKGQWVTTAEITEETGFRKTLIGNTMQYIKKKYPQVKSRHGYPGYCWEEF